MAPVEDVTWTAQGIPLDSGLFTYTWINDGYTLVAVYITSFPPDTIISYTLGDGFQNESGERGIPYPAIRRDRRPAKFLWFSLFPLRWFSRFQATITGSPGALIVVEASSNLIDWAMVTSLSIPVVGTVSFEDPNPLNTSGGFFYRLRTF